MSEPQDVSTAELLQLQARYREKQRNDQFGQIDFNTGAEQQAIAAVSLAKTPNDQVATARKFHPTAGMLVMQGGEKLNKAQGTSYYQQPQEVLAYREGDKPDGRLIAFMPNNPIKSALTGLETNAAPFIGGAVGAYKGGVPGMVLGEQVGQQINDSVLGKALGTVDTRTFGQTVMDRLHQAGWTAGLGAAGEAGAQVYRGLRMGSTIPLPGNASKQTLQDLEAINAPLGGAAQMVTNDNALKAKIQNLLRNPNVMNSVGQKMSRTWQAIADEGKRIFNGLTSASDVVQGGGSAQRGIVGALDNMKQAGDAAERVFDAELGSSLKVPGHNTITLVQSKLQNASSMPASEGELVPRIYKNILSDLQQGKTDTSWNAFVKQAPEGTASWENHGAWKAQQPVSTPVVDWQAFRELRRRVYDELPKDQADQLYGAMTQDLKDAISLHPNLAVQQMFEKEQANWADYFQRKDALQKVIDAPSMDKAWQNLFSSKGTELLSVAKRTVDPATWNDIVGVKLKEMGMSARQTANGETAKEFSANQFITKWKEMPDPTKDFLFGQQGVALRNDLDRLARLTARQAQTTPPRIGSGGAGGAENAPLAEGVTMGVLGAKASATRFMFGWLNNMNQKAQAELLTDPDFVRWLVNGRNLPLHDSSGMAVMMGRLGGMTAGKSDTFKNALGEYANSFSQFLEEAQKQTKVPTL